MGSLLPYYSECRKILCLTAKRRETITYAELAWDIGLKSPHQQWKTVLGPMSKNEVERTGRDLTLIVVYASGPAKGLGRSFSNCRVLLLARSRRLGEPGEIEELAPRVNWSDVVPDVWRRSPSRRSSGSTPCSPWSARSTA
jgi:hypothetical protein